MEEKVARAKFADATLLKDLAKLFDVNSAPCVFIDKLKLQAALENVADLSNTSPYSGASEHVRREKWTEKDAKVRESKLFIACLFAYFSRVPR